ncbi:MAG: carboxylating nicotinate-nucleotide diphosphorylase [Ignavibacteriaceae bacterium]|nr:carboxylating nicotinate-nucleotide diphosphorylase [Ignavibacteriaceae bacterium]
MNRSIEDIIRKALEEDIQTGDLTTRATIPNDVSAEGKFLVKADGIIAGLEIAEKVFRIFDEKIAFNKNLIDGSFVKKGTIAAIVLGRAASLLTAERTALNFLQRMSGIATLTNAFQQRINHTKAKILDTRKTVPGLRELDKLAVKIGGGKNHRFGLFDMFLIKDNHIAVAGSITKAVQACIEYRNKKNSALLIEVETTNLEQVQEALNANADIIMLDNFQVDMMKEAVKLVNGKCKLEASGGITLETVKQIAETGVDYISSGALTHSVKALDISLEISILKSTR